MTWDCRSLLYASTYGVRFSESERLCLSEHSSENALELVFSLDPATQEKLHRVQWKIRWQEFLRVRDRHHVKFCTIIDSEYPEQFRGHEDAPLFISYLGQALWNDRPMLAVVGSRSPHTESLKWMSECALPVFKQLGIAIVSGGARGVDQWSHYMALAAGTYTCVVVPSGLNQIYPDSLQEMIPKILEGDGAILSGYAVNQEMRKFFFHQRNRWISMLAKSCFVVEAGLKSGSLLTGNLCAELGRDVFTLPFSPWSSNGAGNLKLIKEGAQLIETREDLHFALSESFDAKYRKSSIHQPQ